MWNYFKRDVFIKHVRAVSSVYRVTKETYALQCTENADQVNALPADFTYSRSRKRCENMFKVSNKNTRGTSLTSWCFYYYLWKYFTPLSTASFIDFEQIKVSWAFSCLSYNISSQEHFFNRTIISPVSKICSKLATQKIYFNFKAGNIHWGNPCLKSTIKTLVQRLFSRWNLRSWLWIGSSPPRFKLPTWKIVSSIF